MTYATYLSLSAFIWLVGISTVIALYRLALRRLKRHTQAFEEALRTASLYTNEQLAYMVYQLRNENEALRESLIGEFACAVYQQGDRKPDNDQGDQL